LRHDERRHGAGAGTATLDRCHQDQAIHDGGQHAHGVRRGARQTIFRHLGAAQDIAAADHDAEIDAEIVGGDQIGGKTIDGRLMNAELFRAAKGFPGELYDDPPVFRFRHRDVPLLAADSREIV
jgi:hypothetical protein